MSNRSDLLENILDNYHSSGGRYTNNTTAITTTITAIPPKNLEKHIIIKIRIQLCREVYIII